MIKWTTQCDEFWDGTFNSDLFRNSDNEKELEICIDSGSVADYAEKCVASFNHLPDPVITKICKGIIKCSAKHSLKWRLRSLQWKRDPLSVLKHCCFSSIYVNEPKDPDKISYIVEGEGEWDDVFGLSTSARTT